MSNPRTPGGRRREPDRAQRAFEMYVAMGPARSLKKLCRHYADVAPDDEPPLVTAKYWSRTYGWQARVAQHDAQVSQGVENKVVERQVEQRTDALGQVDSFLVEVARILAQHADRETPLQLNTPQDFRAVASAFTDLARAKELLEGRADSRSEHRTAEEIDNELAALRKQEADLGLGPDGSATQH